MKNVEKVAKTILADTAADAYFKFVKRFNKAEAKKKVEELEGYIELVMAKAKQKEFGGRRDWDGWQIEKAQERLEPVYMKVEQLKWYIKNPDKKPPKEILEWHKEKLEQKEEWKKEQEEKKKTFSKFPDLVGKRIFWKSVKRQGEVMNGIVIKQKLDGWEGKPRYKTDSGWTVPHRLVKKIITPRSGDDVVKNIQEQKEKQKEVAKDLKPGMKVEWSSSKHGDFKGKIIEVGRTRIKARADYQNEHQWWTLPMRLITRVNGKKVKFI